MGTGYIQECWHSERTDMITLLISFSVTKCSINLINQYSLEFGSRMTYFVINEKWNALS